MNTIQMYDAQADSIKVEDIATNENNRIMLSRIERNSVHDRNNHSLWIQSEHDDDGEECVDYVPEGANDMGWLGYFIGKNEYLTNLNIRTFEPLSGASVMEVLEPFFSGISNNKSITHLDIGFMDLLGGKIFTILSPFFESSQTIGHITIQDCYAGDEGWRLLALALGSCKHKSLECVEINDNDISDEALVDIITALSMHPNLKSIELNKNRLCTKGCMALATLLRSSVTKLEWLHLDSNEINDEGLDALLPALKNCSHLKSLSLDDNSAVSSKGWQRLGSLLEAPYLNFTNLYLAGNNNVNDEVVTALTRALTNNHKLTSLGIDDCTAITDEGWNVFSTKLLCDTSSVNATYLSNHTLEYVTSMNGISTSRASLQPLLDMNHKGDKKEVAIIKILQNHNGFDMTSFFEWEFKVLPLMIDWFEKASTVDMPEDFEPNIGPRKLSSIYQFVRGMPLLYVETRLKKELEDIKASESKMVEEQHGLEENPLDLETKCQLSQKRKRNITERLDQQW